MADNRTPRNLETRQAETRARWRPASVLPNPDPREGVVHRWIATSVMGEAQTTNVQRKLYEGWQPVKAGDYPELFLQGNKDGNVEIGGLMLCSMPAEMAKQRDEYYAEQAQNQAKAVDATYKGGEDARMPLLVEKRSEVSTKFGNGT